MLRSAAPHYWSSYPAKAGYPVRCGFSIRSLNALEYLVARSRLRQGFAGATDALGRRSLSEGGKQGDDTLNGTTRSLAREADHHSSGQGSTIFQSSSPFLIFFISVVSPP